MVNIGKPSSGCHLCRRRRVKCDEGKPECHRCIKIGKRCPGYRDQAEFLFRNKSFRWRESHQTSPQSPIHYPELRSQSGFVTPVTYASSPRTPSDQTSHAMKQTMSTITDVSSPEDDDDDDEEISAVASSDGPNYTLRYNLEDQSLSVFINSFVVTSKEIFNIPYLTFLPQMLQESGDQVSLRKTMQVVANTNLANRIGPLKVDSREITGYGEALAALNSTLRDPNRCRSDAALISVWLLSLHEALSAFSIQDHNNNPPAALTQEWNSHLQGTMALLLMRGASQLSTPRGISLFRMTHVAIVTSAMMNSYPVPDEFASLVKLMYKMDGMATPATIKVASYYHDVTNLRAKIKISEFQQANSSVSKLLEILWFADALEKGMVDWSDREDSQPIPIFAPLLVGQPNYGVEVFSQFAYPGFSIFLNYIKLFTARFLLHESLIEACLNFLDPSSFNTTPGTCLAIEARIKCYKTAIQKTANELIGSVAYAIGRFDDHGRPRYSLNRNTGAAATPLTANFIASFQTFGPLNIVRQSRNITPVQAENANRGIRTIREEFRSR